MADTDFKEEFKRIRDNERRDYALKQTYQSIQRYTIDLIAARLESIGQKSAAFEVRAMRGDV